MNKLSIPSHLWALLLGVLGFGVSIFPADTPLARFGWISAFLLASCACFYSWRKEALQSDAQQRSVHSELRSLSQQLADREAHIQQLLGRPDGSVPLLVLRFTANTREEPEKRICVENVGASPAFNIRLSSVVCGEYVITFEDIPALDSNARAEFSAVVERQEGLGPFWQRNIAKVLENAWMETRFGQAAEGSKSREEVREILSVPVSLDLGLEWKDPAGQTHKGAWVLEYNWYGNHAYVRMRDA